MSVTGFTGDAMSGAYLMTVPFVYSPLSFAIAITASPPAPQTCFATASRNLSGLFGSGPV